MTSRSAVTFDDILVELLEENATPDHRVLLAWSARYPRFADELADYFAAWALQEDQVDAPLPCAEHLANAGLSRALELFHARKQMKVVPQTMPPRRLSAMVRECGFDDLEIARRLGIDEGIIVKLDRSRIKPVDGIASDLIEGLSDILHIPPVELWRSVSQAAAPAARGGLRKARGRAVLGVESFEQAIRSSTLADESKAAWIERAKKRAGPRE